MQIFITALLILLPILFAIKGKNLVNKEVKNRYRFYIKNIASDILLLLLFYILMPSLYDGYNFDELGKGFQYNELVSAIPVVFIVPFFLTLFEHNNSYSKKSITQDRIMGFPIKYLPGNIKEFIIFNMYIIVGVIFEELLCRQFMFTSFYYTFFIKGDLLLIVSSLLFAIAHLYQGWKGVFSSFLYGLLLGKIFQFTETITLPILLHLVSNLTISILSYRRIRKMQAITN